MSLEDAHKLALKVLKEVMEEKVDGNNVQLAQVRIYPFTLISRAIPYPFRAMVWKLIRYPMCGWSSRKTGDQD